MTTVDLSFTQDPLFTFNEERHLYHYDGKPLDSVSSIQRMLTVPFPRDRIAGYVARKRGITRKAVLAEWEEKRVRASARGNAVHSCVEKFLATGCMPSLPAGHGLPPDDAWDVRRRLQDFQGWHATHMHDVQVLGTEVRVYSLALGTAGTMDALVLRGGFVYVGDWKTNGAFTTDADRSYNNLLPPLAHLPDNHRNSYSIQVSLYRMMLHEHGIRTAGGFIVHLPEEGRPALYPALDLRRPLWEYLTAA